MSRISRAALGGALLFALLAGASAQGSTAGSPAQPADIPHARDHVLVKLEPGARASQVLEDNGSDEALGRWRVQPVPPGRSAQEVVDDLVGRPGVETAELDYLITLDSDSTAVPLGHVDPVEVDDPRVGRQWHFPAVQLDSAWGDSTGAGVVVAVVDTGISKGGEDLDCHTFVAPYNAIDETTGAAAATDDHGHGTHVAGTVAQCTDNGVGVAGVAFDASLMPVKVLNSDGEGWLWDVAEGIDWARSHGADVINLSLSCDGCTSGVVNDAIEAAAADGVTIVAASGNSDRNTVAYPASHPDVIAVGATDYNNDRAPYSNTGNALDLVAPGGDLGQDANGDGHADGVLQETFVSGSFGYYPFQGTSMATPHVSGGVALLSCAAPGLDADTVRDALESTALDLGAPGFDTSYGHGLIQLHDAVESVAAADTTTPTWPGGASVTFSDTTGKSVRLDWSRANDDACVAGYRIYRDGKQVATTGPTPTSKKVSGLAPATGYSFSVRPFDVAGNLGTALSASVKTLDTVTPVWPRGSVLDVTRFGETSLTFAWSKASDNIGVTGYRIRLADTTGFTTTSREGMVTGLQSGSQHVFEVLARDEAGNWSEPLDAAVQTARAFSDTPAHTFYNDILWMSGMDITRGCNPPDNDLYCPDDPVTRGQMAAFLVRALGSRANTHPGFIDVSTAHTFHDDIGKLATADITRGCNPPDNDLYCPDDPVTRAQMAAFIVRALGLTANTHPGFDDVPSSHTFHDDIGKLAAAGITRGCNPPDNDRFCPGDPVTRGELAAFLHRALD